MGIGGEGSSGRNRPQWMLPHLTWPAGPVHAHGGRTRTEAEAAVSTGYQKRKEDWKSLSETRHAPRRSAPSPRSTGPAAGAGRRARRAATSSVAEDGSRTARKAGSAGCRRVGPGGGRPAGVTWSGYTRGHPWWRCWTTAGSCRAGCGPGGRACAGWSRG